MILRSLIPDLPTLLGRHIPDTPPQTPPERLMVAIEQLVNAQPTPLLFTFEDLHWADAESLTLLARLQTLPILIIGTYRDDETPDIPARLPGTKMIKLQRFSAESIATLSESMLGAVGRAPQIINLLERETEGNVFFMVEVMRALAEDAGQLARINEMMLPRQVYAGGMQVVIRRRLARVPIAAMPLLKLAAVAGRRLDIGVLRVVHTDLNAHLTQCADAAVLEIVDDTWRFAHDKLREGLLHDLADDEKILLHRQMAVAIEQVYPDDPAQAAALAYHWGVVRNPERECHYSIRAGDHSFKLFAYAEAIRYYARALALSRDADSETLIYLYLRQARAFELNSQFNEALRNYESLEALAIARHDIKMQSAAVSQIGLIRSVHNPLHSMELALPVIARGLALATEADDPKSKVDLLWAQVINADHYGDLVATRAAGEEAIALARQHGFQERLSYLLLDMARSLRLNGEFETGNAYAREAIDLLRALGNLPMLVDILGQNAWLATLSGDTEACLRLTTESMSICRQIENTWNLSFGHTIRCGTLFLLGRWDEASAACRDAVDFGKQSGFTIAKPTAVTQLGSITRGRGAPESALPLHHEALAAAEESPTFLKGGIAAEIALDYFAIGDSVNGQHWMRLAREYTLVGDVGFALQVAAMAEAVAVNAASDGEWSDALRYIDDLITTVRQRRLIVYLPDALYAKGCCLLGSGNSTAAETTFIDALHAAPDRPTMWPIHAALARLYRQQSQTEQCAVQTDLARGKVQFIADHVIEPTRFVAFAQAEIER